MTEATELAIIPPRETALEVFRAENGLAPYLAKIRAEIDAFAPDVSTSGGRKAIASMAYKVARSKSALDDVGKELVAELKEIPKRIDAERKRMRDTLDAWRDEVRQPLTEWEASEQARIDEHKANIGRLAALADIADGVSASEIAERLAIAEGATIGPQWQEFEVEAARTKDRIIPQLRAALAAREQYEAEQAELARLRAEAAAREQQEREERIAREAAEQARREAEERARLEREAAARREADAQAAAEKAQRDAELAQQRQREAEQRAEAERLAAVERERLAAERARQDELDRQAAEQARLKREAEAREADQAHQAAVHRAVLKAFIEGGLSPEAAKLAVTLIVRQRIPSVSITY